MSVRIRDAIEAEIETLTRLHPRWQKPSDSRFIIAEASSPTRLVGGLMMGASRLKEGQSIGLLDVAVFPRFRETDVIGQLVETANSVLFSVMAQIPSGAPLTNLHPIRRLLGICGDGTNIFCSPWNLFIGCYYTSPETDGLTWKPYLKDQKFTCEPFELHYDAKNGIMYASPWQDGFWALKIEGQ